MRKTVLLMAAAALMCSCSLLKQSAQPTTTTPAAQPTTTTTAATPATTAAAPAVTAIQAGNGAGQALLGLYSQYKADGKFDYTNLSNISNTMLLMGNIVDLPKNVKDKEYLKEFGQGMMLSAASLITPENVEAVTGNLTTIAGQYTEKAQTAVSDAADKAATTVSSAADKLATAAQTAGSIASLLQMFK